MVSLNGSIEFSRYTFDDFASALKTMNRWIEQNLVTEEECAAFIVQMFHQIPDELYNRIQDKY